VHSCFRRWPLPTITTKVTFNGTTQYGFAGTPVVQLDGAGAGVEANGLTINANHCTTRGLVRSDFGGTGIAIDGSNNPIEGDCIGVEANGASPEGNAPGVLIQTGTDNTVGGTSAAARNVISGNEGDGMDITGCGRPWGGGDGLRPDGREQHPGQQHQEQQRARDRVG
jgi:hypothetical protein